MIRHITSRLVLFFAAASLLVVAGCESSPKIRTDYDRSADFSQYNTYDFYDPMGIEEAQYQSLVSKYFRDSIGREMEMRGYKRAMEPDVLINVTARIDDKIRVTSSPSTGMYYGHGYRSSRYGFYHGYGTETDVRQYKEGTVTIDLVDARRQELVWTAAAVGTVTDKKLKNLYESVNNGIAAVFAEYPFRAGQNQPPQASN